MGDETPNVMVADDHWQLGSDVALRFADLTTLRSHMLALLSQAQRQLCIQTPDLEPAIYDQAEIEVAIKRLLTAHPRHQVRILVGNSAQAMRRGHRLLVLARRMTSNLLIRRPPPEQSLQGSILIVDEHGLLRRPDADLPNGYVRYGDRAAVKLQQQSFDTLWQQSRSDPELRSMLL